MQSTITWTNIYKATPQFVKTDSEFDCNTYSAVCLVWHCDGYGLGRWYGDDLWRTEEHPALEMEGVTHWAELPAPPEGE